MRSQIAAFITLYDLDTLKLYLSRGVYGFLMAPTSNKINPKSKHYDALSDYACLRNNDHVFFFLKRKIIYGGQIIGAKDIGAFYLNGKMSPLGLKYDAKISWDESRRSCYGATEQEGVFLLPKIGLRCQPYLILFKDQIGFRGNFIYSDDLYWQLGDYHFPLPSNSIQGMGFCILTPKETKIALELFEYKTRGKIFPESLERIDITHKPDPFKTKMLGFTNIKDAFCLGKFINEAHLGFSIISTPSLIEQEIPEIKNLTICRQIPLSPFKPVNMDRADICCYSDSFLDGAIPKIVIELKNKRANQYAIDQTIRYLDWINRISDINDFAKIHAYILAPSFTNKVVTPKYQNQIHMISYSPS